MLIKQLIVLAEDFVVAMDRLRKHFLSLIIVADLVVMDHVQAVIQVLYHFADYSHVQEDLIFLENSWLKHANRIKLSCPEAIALINDS